MDKERHAYTGLIKFSVMAWNERYQTLVPHNFCSFDSYEYWCNRDDVGVGEINLESYKRLMLQARNFYKEVYGRDMVAENVDVVYKSKLKIIQCLRKNSTFIHFNAAIKGTELSISCSNDLGGFLKHANLNRNRTIEIFVKPKKNVPLRKQWDVMLVCRCCGKEVLCPDCNTEVELPVKLNKYNDSIGICDVNREYDFESLSNQLQKSCSLKEETAKERSERPTLANSGIRMVNKILTGSPKKSKGAIPKEYSSIPFLKNGGEHSTEKHIENLIGKKFSLKESIPLPRPLKSKSSAELYPL